LFVLNKDNRFIIIFIRKSDNQTINHLKYTIYLSLFFTHNNLMSHQNNRTKVLN